MTQIQKSPTIFFTLIAILAASLLVPAVFANPITISTQKPSYGPGEQLAVMGTASANAQISIQVWDPSGARKVVAQTQADAQGAYNATGIYTFSNASMIGIWKVIAYDGLNREFSSPATFTVGAVSSLTLTITRSPQKDVYGVETINITVTANKVLSTCMINVTQKSGAAVAVTATATANPSVWTGAYSIVSGFDGAATIAVSATGSDGTTATANDTFFVQTAVSPDVQTLKTQVATLQGQVSALNSTVTSQTASITTLNGQVTDLTSKINDLTSRVNSINTNAMLVYGALIIGVIAIVLAAVSLARKK